MVMIYPPIYVQDYFTTLSVILNQKSDQFRSIQLIATVTSRNLKEYGFEKVLKPFILDDNRLEEVIHSLYCTFQ